ncbi:MAG: DUF6452 family protein [Flavobacteriaceae bacterium]|nr:DUF6452 family protein [Flavobacteriaceae bacterium]
MKKNTLYIALMWIISSLIVACEKDEICLEEITPKLIIRFYDFENPNEFKPVAKINVQIEGIEGDYFDVSTTTDSIAIPIKVTEDISRFKLTINQNDGDDTNDNTDVFDLNYIREDIFISRSCGYKTIFNEVTTKLNADSDNWIIEIETVANPQNILNQQSNHVKIFH